MSHAPVVSGVPGSLGPSRRRRDWGRLRGEEFDILVIGGGVTGTGCVLDAVTRGLTVALVEQRDLASGTSSRSSKLLHGGLRYLEHRDFALVREALHERGVLAGTVCPHLVRPVSFLIPLRRRFLDRLYYGAGVLLYDIFALGRHSTLPRHRHLSRTATIELAGALEPDGLVGGIVFYDAQIDDARHTLAVARTAARHGAAVLTSAKVTGLVRRDDGAVAGAVVVDVETGETATVRARKVVNATGVWLDEVQDMAGSDGLRVQAAKGVHLVVRRDRIDSAHGMILRTPTSVLFIIAWDEHWLIGTTDTAYRLDRAHPAASKADIDYLLEQANRALRRPLAHDDIVGVYAGLRPLIAGEADSTARLSREHAVSEAVPGLISIAGGKYTTYRIMAADAIDLAAKGLDRPVPASSTASIPLIGAAGWGRLIDSAPRLAGALGLRIAVAQRLLWRHGSRVGDVLALLEDRPELAAELPGGGYLEAEVVHAARHEGALHLDDVLARRLRVSIENDERGLLAAEKTAELMAPELGWSPEQVGAEITAWRCRVEAELAANALPDESKADARRRQAIDARGLIDTATAPSA